MEHEPKSRAVDGAQGINILFYALTH